jgi:hypothetical protein
MDLEVETGIPFLTFTEFDHETSDKKVWNCGWKFRVRLWPLAVVSPQRTSVEPATRMHLTLPSSNSDGKLL